MGIYAKSTPSLPPVPSGNYAARCYRMVEIGHVKESFQGESKLLHKIWISWEIPEAEHEGKPRTIDAEYTLSMNEKANLRKMLASWHGKDFTADEAKEFDVSKLVGIACLINIIHKTSGSGNEYAAVASVSPLPKSMPKPEPHHAKVILSYDNFDYDAFNSLPDFIKEKMKGSAEYFQMTNGMNQTENGREEEPEPVPVESHEDLPF